MAQKSQLDFRFSDLRIDPESPLPKQRQIYAALREAILDGKLNPNDVLPSTRELAGELGVSRNTVLAAYELLLAEGYIAGRGGAGTYVAQNAARHPASLPPERIEPRPLSSTAEVLLVEQLPDSWESPSVARPFRPSSPAFDAFPFTTWARILTHHSRGQGRFSVADGDTHGQLRLRRAITEHLRAARSCNCEPDQVFVTSGSQLGLFLCSMLLMDKDDAVWTEEPGFPDAHRTFRARTTRVIPVPVDSGGIDIEAGKALSPQPRVIYVTPTNQWPLGIVMPIQRRLALLQFAAERKAWIVEDDYAGDLRYDGKAYSTLQGLDEADRVIHLGTFSTTMLPGLRLGYILVPPDLVDAFAAARRIVDRYPNTLAQAGLTDFIERGLYHRHRRRCVGHGFARARHRLATAFANVRGSAGVARTAFRPCRGTARSYPGGYRRHRALFLNVGICADEHSEEERASNVVLAFPALSRYSPFTRVASVREWLMIAPIAAAVSEPCSIPGTRCTDAAAMRDVHPPPRFAEKMNVSDP
jgi:GntR family transcriptional regulator/MocR family aminotransferase